MRLAAYSRRRETGIMRLVGASKFYIQLPFLLESVISALLGAALAVAAIVGIKIMLVDRFLEPNFEFTPFVGWDTVWVVSAILVGIGVLLAGLSAVVTLRRYLKV